MIRPRKPGKQFLLIILTTFLSLSVLSIPAYANTVQKQIQVVYNNIKVTVNAQQVQLSGTGNNILMPFNYNGSIYLPLRAITEALEYTVTYDSTSNTVNLSRNTTNSETSADTPPTDTPPTGTPPTGTPSTDTAATGTNASATSSATVQKQITINYNNVKVMLNDELLELKDAAGNTVEPINYNGSIYLPVRAFVQALDLTVSYDAASNTVVIGSSNG